MALREAVFAAAPYRLPGAQKRYRLLGLDVRSELSLPLTPARPTGPAADLDIRRLSADDCPPPDGPEIASIGCPIHAVDMRVNRGPSGAWIWFRALGACHIWPDLRHADFYVEDGADEKALGMAIAGPVVVYVLNQLGRPSLHASGVVLDGAAALFLGPGGGGKSTMAAAFLRAGATVLGDDIVPIRLVDGTVRAAPSVPFMKVHQNTAELGLGIQEELPELMALCDKRMLPLAYHAIAPAAPIRRLYVLNRYQPGPAGTRAVGIEPLGPRDGMSALLAQTAFRRSMLPREEAPLLPLFVTLLQQAPVRLLSFPHGFEYQASVLERVAADVELAG